MNFSRIFIAFILGLLLSCKNHNIKDNDENASMDSKSKSHKINTSTHTYHFEPDTSILTGKLVIRKFFGPPGWGETPKIDDRYSLYFLVLPKMINVLPADASEVEIDSVKEVQLEYLEMWEKDDSLKKHVNHIVNLKGLLEGPDGSPAQFAKVMMGSIKVIDKKNGNVTSWH